MPKENTRREQGNTNSHTPDEAFLWTISPRPLVIRKGVLLWTIDAIFVRSVKSECFFVVYHGLHFW